MASDDRLMKSAEVAAYLRVPIETLYRWRRLGSAPPGIPVGRQTLYRWADVEAWLDERAKAAAR